MSNLFLTQNNINILKTTLTQIIGNNIDFNDILTEAIHKTNNTLTNKPPNNMSLNNYILEKNKEVILLVMNDQKLKTILYNQQVRQQVRQPVNQQPVNQQQDNQNANNYIFDPNRQLYKDANKNIIENPELQRDMKRNIQLSDRLNQYKDNRDELIPKQKPIEFLDNIPENEEPAEKLYENILKERKNEQINNQPSQNNKNIQPNQLVNVNQQIKKDYYINIDSRHRNLFLYPNPFNFQITFNKIIENHKIIPELTDQYGNIIYTSKRIFLLDINNENNFKLLNNISKIECKHVIIPIIDILSFNEPYLILKIKELDSIRLDEPYLSMNCFAKLIPNKIHNNFVELLPVGSHEIFNNINNIKLDTLTFNIVKNNGLNYFNNLIDKLYVKNIEVNSNGLLNIYVQNKHFEYSNKKINNLNIGDTLYFYDSSPLIDDIIFFNTIIRIKDIKKCNDIALNIYENEVLNINDSKLDILINYRELMCITSEILIESNSNKNVYNDIDFKYIFPKLSTNDQLKNIGNNNLLINSYNKQAYYIYISYKSSKYNGKIINNFLNIQGFNKKSLIIEIPDDFDIDKDKNNIIKFGYVECNLKGRQNNDDKSLFYKGGHQIVNIDETNNLNFSINISKNPSNNYLPNQIFFIQHKFQSNLTIQTTF